MTKLYRLYQFFTFLALSQFAIIGACMFALFNDLTDTSAYELIEKGEEMGR